jgi:hypothetical protein
MREKGVILGDAFVLARDRVEMNVTLMISVVEEKFNRNDAMFFRFILPG